PVENSIKIGLVAYNENIVSYQNLINLSLSGSLNSLKTIINNYSTGFQTNTLKALNKEEETLAPINDPSVEKIIILMSDGIPGIDGYTITNPTVITNTCDCGGNYPNCTECCNVLCKYNLPASDPACITPAPCKPIVQYMFCGKCYDYTCSCGGTYPNCSSGNPCPAGQDTYDCGATCVPIQQPPHSAFNNFIKIKRFFSRLLETKIAQAVTAQTQCIYRSCAAAFPNISFDSASQYLSCSVRYGINCDLTPDVNTEADAIKKLGISLYTIYYNTSNDLTPKQRMCDWSSNNGLNCDNNVNTFAGTDINLMINKVLGRIITKPKDIIIAPANNVIDSDPTAIVSYANGTILKGLPCGAVKPLITFSNNGYLEFSNLKLDYCGARLHS
ncbi:MAG: vWA domain-containing protein, partial [Patescibacteria group bacterium]